MHKVRPRIQRAFIKWLQENKHRFNVPVKIARRTDQAIELVFAGLHPAFLVCLNSSGIKICVYWQGVTWDILYSIDVEPSGIAGGYHCKWVYPEYQQLYISREALWVNELFEPFLKLVNEKLATAKWLALYLLSPCSSSWAKLHTIQPEENEHLFALLPCRIERYSY